MINVKIMLLAENVIRDTESNRMTAINIFENMTVPDFPLYMPTLCVLTISERARQDPAKHDCKLLIKLNKERVFETPVAIDFQDKLSNRAVLKVLGFVIPHPGKLEASLMQGRRRLARCDIDVVGVPRILKKETD